MTALHDLTAAEQGAAIAAGSLSPVALVEHYLARIAQHDGVLHAYIEVLADRALAAARVAESEAAAGKIRGPLHGVPFAVKDNYHVAGVRTTGGSRRMLDHMADETSTAIEKLEAAGAILLGKLNTWEYGTGNGGVYFDLPFEPARNPWDVTRFTGGSSSGSGCAAAAGLASFTLGSDTGGSVRLPAAACGLQGIKPTYGRISRAGLLPNCWSLDVLGPLCRSAEDAALVLRIMSGVDPRDDSSSDEPVPDYAATLRDGVAGLTIALIDDLGPEGSTLDTANFEALLAAADVLQSQGARLIELKLPEPLTLYRRTNSIINWSESFSIHEQDMMDHPDKLGRALKDKMLSGSMVRAADYLAAQRYRKHLAKQTDNLFAQADLLLLPNAFHIAPVITEEAPTIAFTRDSACPVFSVSGHPAMSFRTGFEAQTGMPLNAQIAGRYFDEATVLRAVHAHEAATPFATRRPELAA